MIIILKPNSDKEKIKDLLDSLKSRNIGIHYSEGKFVDIIGLIGDTSHLDINSVMASSDIIETVKRVSEPYKAVNRKFHPDDTVVDVDGAKIGGQVGTTGQQYIYGNESLGFAGYKNVEFSGFESPGLAVQSMLNGNIDYVIVDKAIAINLLKNFNK